MEYIIWFLTGSVILLIAAKIFGIKASLTWELDTNFKNYSVNDWIDFFKIIGLAALIFFVLVIVSITIGFCVTYSIN